MLESKILCHRHPLDIPHLYSRVPIPLRNSVQAGCLCVKVSRALLRIPINWLNRVAYATQSAFNRCGLERPPLQSTQMPVQRSYRSNSPDRSRWSDVPFSKFLCTYQRATY